MKFLLQSLRKISELQEHSIQPYMRCTTRRIDLVPRTSHLPTAVRHVCVHVSPMHQKRVRSHKLHCRRWAKPRADYMIHGLVDYFRTDPNENKRYYGPHTFSTVLGPTGDGKGDRQAYTSLLGKRRQQKNRNEAQCVANSGIYTLRLSPPLAIVSMMIAHTIRRVLQAKPVGSEEFFI